MSFYQDVICHDPRFGSPLRCAAPELLEPITAAAVQAIMADAAAMGIPLILFETFRSRARQQALFKAGATRLQQVGVHNYGLAADLCKNVGGQPSWKGNDWQFLKLLANKHGLVWGGDWGSPGVKHDFIDSVHVQRCSLADEPKLFAGTWYPPDDYDPSSAAT